MTARVKTNDAFLFISCSLGSRATSSVSVLIYGFCADILACVVAYWVTLDTRRCSCTGNVCHFDNVWYFTFFLLFCEFVLPFQLDCFVLYLFEEMTNNQDAIQVASQCHTEGVVSELSINAF